MLEALPSWRLVLSYCLQVLLLTPLFLRVRVFFQLALPRQTRRRRSSYLHGRVFEQLAPPSTTAGEAFLAPLSGFSFLDSRAPTPLETGLIAGRDRVVPWSRPCGFFSDHQQPALFLTGRTFFRKATGAEHLWLTFSFDRGQLRRSPLFLQPKKCSSLLAWFFFFFFPPKSGRTGSFLFETFNVPVFFKSRPRV